MGYDDYGPVIILQIPFQPVNSRHIQMIGRLIQKKDIRLTQKHSGKGYFRLLSSGELGKLLLFILRGKAQLLQNDFIFFFKGIAAQVSKLFFQPHIAGNHRFSVFPIHDSHQAFHLFLHLKDIRKGFSHFLFHGQRIIFKCILF